MEWRKTPVLSTINFFQKNNKKHKKYGKCPGQSEKLNANTTMAPPPPKKIRLELAKSY